MVSKIAVRILVNNNHVTGGNTTYYNHGGSNLTSSAKIDIALRKGELRKSGRETDILQPPALLSERQSSAIIRYYSGKFKINRVGNGEKTQSPNYL